MSTVLISGIGGSIGIDVARSLRADPSLRTIGVDANPWGVRQAGHLVDVCVTIPRADRDPKGYLAALERLIIEHQVDLAFINPDPELETFAEQAARLSVPTSMPSPQVVAIGLDKAETVARVGRDDLFPATVHVSDDADVERAFRDLGSPLWVRSAIGPGGRGSLVVDNADEAHSWMRYWNRRGKGYTWVLHEFLPGDNINWTGLYVDGELRCEAAMKRLRYFLGDAAASGVSGQVNECATVDPARYRETSDQVVRALEDRPHGLFSIDLRHDARDRARVTEVNPRLAGRPWLYTSAGCNIALASARALIGHEIGDALQPGGLRVGLHLYRQLDVDPVVGLPDGLP